MGLIIAAPPAYAELDEIVVTARKREEKLQELPMSVTAISSEQMERLGVRDLADVTRYTPGVNLDSGFGLNDQRLVIRGLSPSRGRPNSAILVDGIDLTTESVSTAGGSMLFNSRLLDIERVEVVKGPQSAMYGRAAFTGAIQYVTRDPGDELETDFGVDLGDYGRTYINAGVGGPVTDTLGIRLNAMSWNDEGFYGEGFTNASLGGGEGLGFSLTGKWQPSDAFSARARVAYSDDEFDQQATLYNPENTFITPPTIAQQLPGIGPNNFVGVFTGKPQDVNHRSPFLTADPRTGAAYPGGEQQVLNSSLIMSWDVPNATITSYTGYAKADSGQIIDGDFNVRPNADSTMDIARGGSEIDFQTNTRMFSQEIRLASDFDGPVQITVGALYWDENVDQDEYGLSALGFPFGPAGADPGYFNLLAVESNRIPNEVNRSTTSKSMYGLMEWSITDTWKLSIEGRRATEDMQVRGSGCDPAQPFAGFRCGFSTPDLSAEFPPGSGIYDQLQKVYAVDRSSDNYFAPRVLLEWSIADNVLTYASISKGVKPGGIGTVASGTWMDQEPDGDLDELKFDAETLIAYELGVKSTLFDNTVTLNGAIFFQDYSDKQVPVQTITNGFPFSSIENAGKANVRGLELEAVWQVVDHVRLQAGYSYLDGKYTDLVYQTNSANSIARAGNCQLIDSDNVGGPDQCAISLSGNSLEDVPEHSLIAMVGYYPPFNSRLNGLLETDMEYQSSRYNDEFNDREVDSYVLFNLRAGVQSDRWDALLYVNNVLDDDTIRNWSSGNGLVATAERTDSNMVAFPSDGFSLAPAPRHWGLRLNMRF